MSPARVWAMVVVAILHVLIGFAFVTGFYQKFTKEGPQDLDVFDVTEEPPPPEEEPPPPDEPVPEVQSPEVVAPPPIIQRPQPVQQQVQTVQEQQAVSITPRADTQGEVVQRQTFTCPGTGQLVYSLSECRPPEPRYKQCPGGQRVLETATCPAVEPATPPTPARIQNPGAITNDDYPASALRAEAQGTTRITLQVGPNGRATGCSVTGSSGNGSLDSTACSLAQRRFRFTPATRNGQPVAGTASTSIRWVLPEE